ncbi:MAG: gliding motility protein GldB [Tannerella sp.]|jgi:hypothetical protein|nr:gliding motility protein GldB [Tannerella sp.]
MRNRVLTPLMIAVFLLSAGCGLNERAGGANAADSLIINRFDKALYAVDDTAAWDRFAALYPEMLTVVGRAVFNTQDTHTPEFRDRVMNYFAEPTLNSMYADALKTFDKVDAIEEALGQGFSYLHTAFPEMQQPAVYMHVSGFGQNLLVADSLLSISIDKYLGADYPLYQDFFYDFQRQRMKPDYVAIDYLAAWLMSEYPFTGDDRVLLDRMIYEGKIKYIISQALTNVIPETLLKYSPDEYHWCRENEQGLWHIIIERQHLYTPDHVTTSKYLGEQPATFIANDAPPYPAVWLGLQIVRQYVRRTKATPLELMQTTDYQGILAGAKYKP